MNEVERKQFQHDLSVLRADYVSLFQTSEAIILAEQQMWNEAARYLKEAMVFFQNHGTTDKHVSELYAKINLYHRQVQNRQVPGSPTEPLSEQAVAENQ